MHSRSWWAPSRGFLGLLLVNLFAFSAFAEFKNTPILSVKGRETYLYARQEKHSEKVIKLEKGERLIPFASALGRNERWYMVKTQNGVLGWVRSSDMVGIDNLERTFREKAASSPLASLPRVPPGPSTSSPQKPTTVPVQMTGSAIFVPVVLNGSLRTYMLLDTGATFTVVTPRIAKKLGLRLDPYSSRVPLMTANGYITAPIARLASLKVGNAEVRGLMVAVHKFSPDSQIAGLLGLNFLNQFNTSIDSGSQLLTLAPQ